MAKDLSTSTLLNNKLQQVAKEAFAIWHHNGEHMHASVCLLAQWPWQGGCPHLCGFPGLADSAHAQLPSHVVKAKPACLPHTF